MIPMTVPPAIHQPARHATPHQRVIHAAIYAGSFRLAEADVTVPQVQWSGNGWACGWIMADAGADGWVQVGWSSAPNTINGQTAAIGLHPWVEVHWGQYQSDVFDPATLTPGSVHSVAIVQDSGHTWHLSFDAQTIWSGTIPFRPTEWQAASAEVQVPDGDPMPVVSGARVTHRVLWNPHGYLPFQFPGDV